jgi:hypothetical protein
MDHNSLDPDQKGLLRHDALATQLTRIERRRLPCRLEDANAIVTNHRPGVHVDMPPEHGREMTARILQFELPITRGNKFPVKFHRRRIRLEFPLSTSRPADNVHLAGTECNCQSGLQC